MLPFDHGHVLANYCMATPELFQKAIETSLARAKEWETVDINDRISALLKAADLASGKYRQDLNAATMLGQGKKFIVLIITKKIHVYSFRKNGHSGRNRRCL